MSDLSGGLATSPGSAPCSFSRGGGETNPVSRSTGAVRFGEEIVDLTSRMEPISQTTFRSLMDEEPDTPFFTFAHIHSRSGEQQNYTHLYSAQNVVDWYPLKGRTDPCTRGNIEKIEYFLLMKGQDDAIQVGNVYGGGEQPIAPQHVSKPADYLVWSHTAEDEPSKMLALLAIAYLQTLGLQNISSNDTFDTSNLSQLDPRATLRSPEQKNTDRLHGSNIFQFISKRISSLIERGELKCSDAGALLSSMEQDAARHLAGILVSQDPKINENSDDYAKKPHIRTNALATAIMQSCQFEQESGDQQRASSADSNKPFALERKDRSASTTDDWHSTARRYSI